MDHPWEEGEQGLMTDQPEIIVKLFLILQAEAKLLFWGEGCWSFSDPSIKDIISDF